MFLVNDKLVWRDKTVRMFHEPWYCDACAFYVLSSFKELEIIISEDNMPDHALDIFIENATKMVRVIKRSNFKVAPKLCIFLYNAMETIGVCQGMIIMHSSVIDTVFHSCDALDSMPQN